jgi:hypothetical protein
MIIKKNELLFKGWQYKDKPQTGCLKDRFQIIPKKEESKELPDKLCKYYPLNKFSLDALQNKYLYASCPIELNDPLDCMDCLLDISKIEFKEEYEEYKKEQLDKSAKIANYKEFKQGQKDGANGYLGIVSLTQNDNDLNMWAHYASNHQGFLISFNTDYLKYIPRLVGPFQINYSDDWATFSLKDKNESFLGFLFQTNIKSKKWKPEYEWRFLRVKKNMSIPKIRMDAKSIENRKSYYDQRCIDEITIGMNFWIDILKSKFTDSIWKIVFEMKEGINLYKYQLLNFLADQNKIRVSTFESKVMPDFSLSKFQIKITKLESDLEFRIERVSNHK